VDVDGNSVMITIKSDLLLDCPVVCVVNDGLIERNTVQGVLRQLREVALRYCRNFFSLDLRCRSTSTSRTAGISV
jgi:hypothetical protein